MTGHGGSLHSMELSVGRERESSLKVKARRYDRDTGSEQQLAEDISVEPESVTHDQGQVFLDVFEGRVIEKA